MKKPQYICRKCIVFVILLIVFSKYNTSYSDIIAVSERTSQVRDAIVAAIPDASSADEITTTHLTTITHLNLRNNGITELQSGDFSGLTGLTSLNLYGNQLSSLPEGIFEGLTVLTSLRLGGNTVDPLTIEVSLEKVAEGQIRAITREGAPFNIMLPISVTNGTLEDNATTITISTGSIASGTITVTATPSDTREVTQADIGTLPRLPRNHFGYVLNKTDPTLVDTTIGNVAPVFTDGVSITLNVDENTEADVNIGTPIAATDMDEGDTLTYTLGGIDAASFDIDAETGQLKTKAALDYETKSFYSVTITASDSLLTDTITVTINVTDVADNFAPTFTNGTITVRTIAENTGADVSIGAPITAIDTDSDADIDDDTDDPLSYTLGGIDAVAFIIDTQTGQLKTKAVLDYENKSLYLVSVTASDGSLTDTIAVVIRLIDIAETDFVTISLPLRERTSQVRDEIVDSVLVKGDITKPDTEDITNAHIAAISVLNLRDAGITQLKSGDFSGMTGLRNINLHDNLLMSLPVGIFEGLTALTTLRLGHNLLDPMPILVSLQQVAANQFRVIIPTGAPFDIVVPIDVTNGYISGGATTATVLKGTLKSETFTFVPTLDTMTVSSVDIGKLPGLPQNHYGYVLARSTACNRTPEVVTAIEAMYPLLMHCQNVADVDLAIIRNLNLVNMDIQSLRTQDFSGMLLLTTLYLNNNELTSLPEGLFDGLLSLRTVSLRGNKLTQLSDGIFKGLVTLESLDISGNTVDPLPLHVTLEQIGEGALKAVVPTGAPFDISLTLTTTNGSIVDGIDSITIPKGSVESEEILTVTRTPDTIDAVTVDIDALPSLPPLHAGYELVKSDALPLEVFSRINVAPVFTGTTPTTHTIPENTEKGIDIGTAFTAIDANNDMLTYSLSGEDVDAFEIDPETGQLTTKEDLDFETQSTYTVIVSATDGVTTVSITVTINIADVDENRAPVFTEDTSATRSVTENAPAGENIGLPVVATDADSDDLTYSLSETQDDNAFDIVSTTGQLKTKAALDYETKTRYQVTISVSDGNEGSASITVTINVSDVDETPTDTTQPNRAPVFTEDTETTRSVAENTPAGRNIGLPVASTDADNDDLTYSLSETQDDNAFDIVSTTGQLKTKAALNYETKTRYQVTISVSDGNNGSASITVTINVSDVDETPIDTTSNNVPVFTEGSITTRSVVENIAAGENIGLPVAATDADNDSLSYSLGETADDNAFDIVSTTGQLKTKDALDYETKESYSVSITVSDGNDGSASITVTINVSDVDETLNNTPVFTEGTETTRSVVENIAAGENIGLPVAATDADNDSLSYSLGETADDNAFDIVSTTGQLKTKAALDYETKESYSVSITVSDGNNGSASITVTINVSDVDETPIDTTLNNTPVFTEGTETTRSVVENIAAGENIGLPVAATDADNDSLSYSLGTTADDNAFDIVSTIGQLKTKAALNYETKQRYTVTITVTDGRGGSDTITVTINVSNVIETPTNRAPVFTAGTSTTRSVTENTAAGRDIGLPVAATDADNDSLSYSLGVTSDDNAFDIVSTTGQLRTKAALDYETKESYSVSITVSDGNDGSVSITVTINVTDEDDPYPLAGRTQQVQDAIVAAVNSVDSANEVTEAHLAAITVLDLKDKNISQLKVGDFHGLSSLTQLDLTVNQLTNLPEYVFDGLSSLTKLFLYRNQLTSLSENVFHGLSSLKEIWLSSNELTSLPDNVFSDLSSLNFLYMAINKLTNLPDNVFNGLTSLRYMDLSANRFTSLSENVFRGLSLTSLKLAANRFTSLPDNIFRGLSSLSHLWLYNNKLTSLPDNVFHGLASLQMLHLSGNELTSLPEKLFNGLASLQMLHLSGNELTSLPEKLFNGLSSLQNMDLSDNELANLPDNVFNGLSSLQNMDLSDNELANLPDNVFNGLSSLTQLNLENNHGAPFSFIIYLEKIADGQFKAVAPIGAPFDIVFPLTVTNGSINGDATTLTIPLGSVASDTFTVTRTAGTTGAVTVDITQLPDIPNSHSGYQFVKPTIGLPTEIYAAGTSAPVFTEGSSTTRSVAENTAAGRDIGLPVQATDAGDDTLTYGLGTTADDNAFDIDSMTGQLKTKDALDYETKPRYQVTISVSDSNGGTDSITVTIRVRVGSDSTLTPVSERTRQVREAIVAEAGVNSAAEVTEDHLAAITYLYLGGSSITSLKVSDFDGLTVLKLLDLSSNQLSSLPSSIFDNLSKLVFLKLNRNRLSSLPSGIFDSQTNLTSLNLSFNKLGSLPSDIFDNLNDLETLNLDANDLDPLSSGIFDNLTSLVLLDLSDTQLSSLPPDIFGALTELTYLTLSMNQLSSLPLGIFDSLKALEWLRLYRNQLGSLPSGIFDNLCNLTMLDLSDNQLSSLPPDIFGALTELTELNLGLNDLSSLPTSIFNNLTMLTLLTLIGNAINPLPVTVSLEKVAEGQFKAVVSIGAPFNVVLPLSVTNGSINGGVTSITISQGSDESNTITVTRTAGTTGAVTVNISQLPDIPISHRGYKLVKPTTGLPVEIYAAGAGAPTVNKDAAPQTPNATTLLLNYPNPFNPETWIPYQLAKASDVTITIYNMCGLVVRHLPLGHKLAGFYTSRSRAAHWDGRNVVGEKVAAGVYFCTFKAVDYTATRKMLVRK